MRSHRTGNALASGKGLRALSILTLIMVLTGIKPAAVAVAGSGGGDTTAEPTNLLVSFSVPSGSPCSVGSSTLNADGSSSASVTITGVGQCAVTAKQAGKSQYNAADSVIQSFAINKVPTSVALS